AVVEAHVDRLLRSAEEQSAAQRVFPDDVDDAAARQAADDLLPGAAAIASAQDVRAQIVEAQRVDRGVGRPRLEVARLEDAHFCPGNELLRRHLLPGLSPVARAVDQ